MPIVVTRHEAQPARAVWSAASPSSHPSTRPEARATRLVRSPPGGRVAELADTQDSGSCVRKDMGVQVPPRPPRVPDRTASIRRHNWASVGVGCRSAKFSSGLTPVFTACARRERAVRGPLAARGATNPKILAASSALGLDLWRLQDSRGRFTRVCQHNLALWSARLSVRTLPVNTTADQGDSEISVHLDVDRAYPAAADTFSRTVEDHQGGDADSLRTSARRAGQSAHRTDHSDRVLGCSQYGRRSSRLSGFMAPESGIGSVRNSIDFGSL